MSKFKLISGILFLSIFIILVNGCTGSAPAQATETAVPPTPVPPTPTNIPVETPANWWNQTVFYEIFVRSFYDSDGDGIGDFNGITEKLDYLNDGDPNTTTDLGITGIWLMPIQPAVSYHGYDITDYLAVNPEYGTMEDFKRFLDEAHQRGIRVIMDFVLNHTSDQHPWFVESTQPGSEKRDYYIWSDTDLNYVGPWNEDVWYPGPNGGFYYAMFWSGMPDLNYQNPEVTQEMYNVVDYWLTDVGVDGFRLDAARYLIEEGQNQANTASTHTWYQDFYQYYKSVNPEAMTVGEVWDTSDQITPYVTDQELDLVFDFDLAAAMVNSPGARNAASITNVLDRDEALFPDGQYAAFLTNHDQNRVMNQVGNNLEKAKAAAAFLLTSPGVPFIYYGEEIGMTGAKPDEMIRTPMQWTSGEMAGFTTGEPWEAINSDFSTVNVETEAADPESLFNTYRGLIQLRNAHPALQNGVYYKVDTGNNGVFAMLRATTDEAVLVLVNLKMNAISDYALNINASPLRGNYQPVVLWGEDGEFSSFSVDANGSVTGYLPLPELAAESTAILLLERATP